MSKCLKTWISSISAKCLKNLQTSEIQNSWTRGPIEMIGNVKQAPKELYYRATNDAEVYRILWESSGNRA